MFLEVSVCPREGDYPLVLSRFCLRGGGYPLIQLWGTPPRTGQGVAPFPPQIHYPGVPPKYKRTVSRGYPRPRYRKTIQVVSGLFLLHVFFVCV